MTEVGQCDTGVGCDSEVGQYNPAFNWEKGR